MTIIPTTVEVPETGTCGVVWGVGCTATSQVQVVLSVQLGFRQVPSIQVRLEAQVLDVTQALLQVAGGTGVGVGVADGAPGGVLVGTGDGVRVGAPGGVFDGVTVFDGVDEGTTPVGVFDGVFDGVFEGEGVGVSDGVGVGDGVCVGAPLSVGVGDGPSVGVGVGVGVGVSVTSPVGVGVEVGPTSVKESRHCSSTALG
jgi:hypothetical protein